MIDAQADELNSGENCAEEDSDEDSVGEDSDGEDSSEDSSDEHEHPEVEADMLPSNGDVDYDDLNLEEYEWPPEDAGVNDETMDTQQDMDSTSDDLPWDGRDPDGTMGEDQPEPNARNRTEYFSGAGKTYERGRHLFEEIEATDKHSKTRRDECPHYPFSCEADWQMASTLDSLPLSMAELDGLLKTDYVRPLRAASELYSLE